MIWLIQTNLINPDDLDRVIQAVEQAGVEWMSVKIIPFVDDYMQSEKDISFFDSQDVILLGSTTLVRVAEKRGWGPGVWTEGLNFEECLSSYGKHLLNAEAEVSPFSEVKPFSGSKFIRPVDDSKPFAGQIISGEALSIWQGQVEEGKLEDFASALVLVSDIKPVEYEWRFFVVGGEVVTGSLYAVNGRPMRRKLENTELETGAVRFAERMVDCWTPNEAFVLDIAYVSGEESYRGVEVNGINSSGFYEADIAAVVKAVQSLVSGIQFGKTKRRSVY